MQKIHPFLWFNNNAEEAVNFYLSVFKDGRIIRIARYPDVSPDPAPQSWPPPGSVMTVEFELFGQRYTALNGGPDFQFTPAISLVVNCATQEEVDRYWNALTADGGQPVQGGWLTDRFGVSWQIVPTMLPDLLTGDDAAKAARVTREMLKLIKLDIAALEAAADSEHGMSPHEASKRKEIISTRVLPVSRERLFEAFADPHQLARWWGPKGFTNTFEEFQFHPGGTWRFTMHSPEGAEFHNVSEFTEVVRPERIVFNHLRPVHDFVMTITFEDAPGGTALTWRMAFPTVDEVEELREFISKANEENFDRLQEILSETEHQPHHPDIPS
jgi:predicted 3-demethylubiquinone-9 3-methyltransferase (glyoxalase superfamily)/uncharacterized protein YndB with AHSA1/START domain